MSGLTYVLEIAALSILVVLVALFLLFIIFQIFGLVFNRPGKGPGGKTKIVPKSVASEPAVKKEDGRIQAAIAGALYQYMQGGDRPFEGAGLLVSATQSAGLVAENWKIQGRKALLNQRNDLENIRRKKQSENI